MRASAPRLNEQQQTHIKYWYYAHKTCKMEINHRFVIYRNEPIHISHFHCRRCIVSHVYIAMHVSFLREIFTACCLFAEKDRGGWDERKSFTPFQI
jgi:hypothetical protein